MSCVGSRRHLATRPPAEARPQLDAFVANGGNRCTFRRLFRRFSHQWLRTRGAALSVFSLTCSICAPLERSGELQGGPLTSVTLPLLLLSFSFSCLTRVHSSTYEHSHMYSYTFVCKLVLLVLYVYNIVVISTVSCGTPRLLFWILY